MVALPTALRTGWNLQKGGLSVISQQTSLRNLALSQRYHLYRPHHIPPSAKANPSVIIVDVRYLVDKILTISNIDLFSLILFRI
jgi:hypothetical protein